MRSDDPAEAAARKLLQERAELLRAADEQMGPASEVLKEHTQILRAAKEQMGPASEALKEHAQILRAAKEQMGPASEALKEHAQILRAAEEQMGPAKEALKEHAQSLRAVEKQMAPFPDHTLTIQRAADHLLREAQHALSARELAERALSLKIVHSSARDPVYSLAQTLEKNIREQLYNDPALKFVYDQGKRLLALPDWPSDHPVPPVESVASQVTVKIPHSLTRDLKLAVEAGLASGLEDALVKFARHGLSATSAQIREAIIAKLDQFGNDDESVA